MERVGLTGGIAAGKSVATRHFQELGITVLDYDQLARAVVEPGTPGLAAVVAAFGDEVLTEDGRLNRSLLAHKVFGDDEARERLEEIVHPLVIAESSRLDSLAEAAGERIVVHDIPLLVEVAGPDPFDAVIVIDAPPEVRAARLINGRGWTEEEAWGRIDAQIDDEVRREAADVVFDGSGTEENLCRQIDEWVADVTRRGLHYRPQTERTKFLVTEDWTP